MNPEIKEARSNVFKQKEQFEANIIEPAKALEKLSDEALEAVVGGGRYYDDVVNVNGSTINGGINL